MQDEKSNLQKTQIAKWRGYFSKEAAMGGYDEDESMTKDEKITAARAMLEAMGLTADDLADKADDDGWIVWHGGSCPVNESAEVEIRQRGHGEGQYVIDTAENYDWSHYGDVSDIIAYRIAYRIASEPDIDDILPVVNKPWVPAMEEDYWTINEHGRHDNYVWGDDAFDNNALSICGVFPTKEAAEARAQAMRDWEWLKQRSDRKADDLFIPVEFHGHIIPGVGFTSYDKREAAISHIGHERLEILARWLHNLGDK